MAALSHLNGKYSERLGFLTGAQLQAAADRFELGRVVHAEPVAHGLFGQSLFLDTTQGRYVLRGVPHVDEDGLDGWQWRAEQFFAGLIHRHTRVPAPWPYLIDESPEIFGWTYSIMPRMPGANLRDLLDEEGIPAGRKQALLNALGRCAAELGRIRFDARGTFDHRTLEFRPDPGPWRQQVEERIHALLETVAPFDLTTADDLDWARAVLEQNAGALDVPFPPGYVHGDLKANNLTVPPGGNGWDVAGIFDLAEGRVGDGEQNLVRAIFECGRRDAHHIMRGYLGAAPPREGFLQRFRIYMLEDRLVYWNYGVQYGDWYHAPTTFRDTAERFVASDPLAGV